ncbi:immunoglobulin kappa light chain-like [Carcharodon carcharias]|uniref:immunoglobulin kappa light chain-like n=1 Tax=Carcharodon carcharias TaxID=13397 RepID=UPI001B7E1779|nr:immunoglobulin kappa light chain-like [Carcharodon carcharias]
MSFGGSLPRVAKAAFESAAGSPLDAADIEHPPPPLPAASRSFRSCVSQWAGLNWPAGIKSRCAPNRGQRSASRLPLLASTDPLQQLRFQLLSLEFHHLIGLSRLLVSECRTHQIMLLLRIRGVQLSILLHIVLNAAESQDLTVSQTPSAIKALKGQTVIINCSYNENGEQLRIKWEKKDSAQVLCNYTYNKNITKYTLGHCTERDNITVDLSTHSTSLIIHNLHLKDSSIYFCQVSIEIPPPILIAKGNGTHLMVEAAPTVQLRAETLPYPNEDLQLICTSLEFYPESIQVSWFKNGQLITNGTKNGTPYANSDDSFSMTSFLNLSVFDWNEGGNYSCQVNHSTLSAPITERISVNGQGKVCPIA